MINPTPPLARAVIVSIRFGVTAPSEAAIPSQVADRTNRFDNIMPLIVLPSNNLLISFFAPFWQTLHRKD
jgi:hypothetical protein